MQEKDQRLLEIIQFNINKVKDNLYNYKSYIDQIESAIRELETNPKDIDDLFELWSNLEIVYSVMVYEQRTTFNQEELDNIFQSLEAMKKIINKLV